jgi:hypothetical protein
MTFNENMIKEIQSRDEFIDVIDKLSQNYMKNPDTWKSLILREYLEKLLYHFENLNEKSDKSHLSWKYIAETLYTPLKK